MKTLTVTLNPRGWVETWAAAIRNTLVGIGESLKNPRLWIGITLSFVLHGALLLFTLPQTGKAVGERNTEPFIIIGPQGTDHPNVARVVHSPQTPIAGEVPQNATNPIVFKPNLGQANDGLLSDATATAAASDQWMLKINKDLMESTESILGKNPIDIEHHTGGQPAGNPLLVGPQIDIGDVKPIEVGQPLIKNPPGNTPGNTAQNAGQTTGKGSSYTLEGDLTYADIVSSVMPRYPEFARARGLSNVSIQVEFFANSQGVVSRVMVVKRSSGFAEWDALVKQALSGWRFKPSQPSQAGRRFGRITFHFVLS